MFKRRYLILLALLIICTSIFTGAFCLFTVYKKISLEAVTGVSLQITSDERITINTVSSVNPEETIIKNENSDIWWCKKGTAVTVDASIKDGYFFDGWYHDDIKVSDTLQDSFVVNSYAPLTARLELIPYQIIYETNGGTLENTTDSYNVENHMPLPIPSKNGFIFDGWYEEEDFSGNCITSTSGGIGDKIYYAKWIEDPSLLTAFAIYSADDTSLSFYKRSTIPAVNEIYNGKTVTAVYTGIEDMQTERYSDIPWYSDNYSRIITCVTVEDVITPSNIAYWFYYLKNCSNFDLKKLDTSRTTTMRNTFYHAADSVSSFVLDLTHWDTSKVTNMEGMFYYTGSSKNNQKFLLDLSNWDVSSVTTFYQMFQNAGQYASVWSVGDLKTKVITKENGSTYHAWDVSNTEIFTAMFSCVGEGADDFTLDISNWNVSGAVHLGRMFSAFRRAKKDAVIEMDFSTKNVELEDGTIYTAWDLSNYSEHLYKMFSYAGRDAKSFKIDLSSWDISNVNNTKEMFHGTGMNASEFSLGDLSGWNTENIEDMEAMFMETGKSADWSLDLSGWNVSKVTNRISFAYNVTDKIIIPKFQ